MSLLLPNSHLLLPVFSRFGFFGDFLAEFILNINSIFLVQEIFGRYSGDIRDIFGRYSGDIREIFGRYSGDIREIFVRLVRG